jgi:nucleoside phosphorylase
MKTAIFCAFPQELKCIRKNLSLREKARAYPFRIFSNDSADIIAVETGMSIPNIEAAFRHVAGVYRPDVIISAGFGGALYYQLKIGDLVFASRYFFLTREGVVELQQLSLKTTTLSKRSVINRSLFKKLQQEIDLKEGSFVTLSSWMTKSKLRTLMPGDIAFPVCDRETLHLARLAYNRNISFAAMRSISDTLGQDIPQDFFNVVDENGHYRLSRALQLLISRPCLIPGAIRLGRNAAVASRKLGEAVNAFIDVASLAVRAEESVLSILNRKTRIFESL